MTQYHKQPIDLTKKQLDNLSKALAGNSGNSPLTFRLTQDQINKGDNNLLLTTRQQNHLKKSTITGKGSNITLSATQLKKMRSNNKKEGGGMYGVDAPPRMPREAGIGPEEQTGAGIEGEGLKEVGQAGLRIAKKVGKTGLKIVKKSAKIAAKQGCKGAVTALTAKAGISPGNQIAQEVTKELCGEFAKELGSGLHKPKRPRKKNI